eukprot:maker-scaffold_28-snap-gene-3.3-mRNA-1 protein AED:0.02 eAED:0.02 QI:935/0.66/1/1/0.66/0.25/4/558/147
MVDRKKILSINTYPVKIIRNYVQDNILYFRKYVRKLSHGSSMCSHSAPFTLTYKPMKRSVLREIVMARCLLKIMKCTSPLLDSLFVSFTERNGKYINFNSFMTQVLGSVTKNQTEKILRAIEEWELQNSCNSELMEILNSLTKWLTV